MVDAEVDHIEANGVGVAGKSEIYAMQEYIKMIL